MRNTFAATHTAATTDARPTAIDSQTSHHGGGWLDPSRSSIPNVLRGGRWLTTTANVDPGFRDTAGQISHGTMRTSISGICSVCASVMSLTAAPTASMSDPNRKNPIRKKIAR